MIFINSLQFARQLDAQDPLKKFRELFYFPMIHGKEAIYFTGNSLGLQPKQLQEYVLNELEDWATYGVEGHFHARHPWFHYKEFLKDSVAKLLGAKSNEVVVMNSLTVNLHLLLVSFYRPSEKRFKIICEYDAFPSDLYAVQSQAKFHGLNPDDAIIYLKPRTGEYTLRTEDIIQAIEEAGDSLATVMLGAVNYYTGQYFDLEKITEAAHRSGATCGFNLAHATGNVLMKLHDWNVDYACFCSYKYLNAGPGSVAGIFVHEKHFVRLGRIPQFAGWWGNDPETRFKMTHTFEPAKTASAWALSNDPVLSMAALKSSLDIFDEAGIENLRMKSEMLTAYLEFVIEEVNRAAMQKKTLQNEPVHIITPKNKHERGCQLSLVFAERGKEVFNALAKQGVVTDWREPDVIRVAPVPLYNSFEDIFRFGEILKQQLMHEQP
ncbi:MAG: kynureninase [Bacteroidetes bacterium]|nr:kynureninase [Bacteroidota bacterium]